MFDIDNRTPYAVDRTATIDTNGGIRWVVVVKATFDLDQDGIPTLADEQPPPLHLPEFRGDDEARSSLRHESDMLPPKPMVDLLVDGSAYAPEGRPSREFSVGIGFQARGKTLVVRGDRSFQMSLGVLRKSEMAPVVRVPLHYERAYGGFDDLDPNPARQAMDRRNPAGCGHAARPANLVGSRVPNLEYPRGNLKRTGPAGFGAIASHWSPRVEFAGTYDGKWFKQRKPLPPLDFDERSYQCAPVDQQFARGFSRDRRLLLQNLSPHQPLWTVVVPHAHLRFATRFSSAARQPRVDHRGFLNTIRVEPDDNRLELVWSTVIDCGRDIDHITRTRVIEKAAVG